MCKTNKAKTNLIFLSSPGNISDSLFEFLSAHFACDEIPMTPENCRQLVPKFGQSLNMAHVIILNMANATDSCEQIVSKLRSLSDTPIIIMHHYTQKVFADAFIKMGASAYLPINFNSEKLLFTISNVLADKDSVSNFTY